MPRESREFLYVGIKDVVLALNPADGAEIWRTKLKGGDFVTGGRSKLGGGGQLALGYKVLYLL